MSEELKDGGPAFPVPDPAWANGMTLRDWFAGQAIQGLLIARAAAIDHGSQPRTREEEVSSASDAAYIVADAMLAERQKVRDA